METEGGTQIALETYARSSPPFLARQFFPGGRTRDNMNGGRLASISSRVSADTSPTPHGLGSLEQGQYNGHRMEWDVKTWDWDSVLFLAQPTSSAAAATERARSLYNEAQNGHLDRSHPVPSNDVGLRFDGVSSSPDQNGCSDHDDPYVDPRGKHPVGDDVNGHQSYSGKAQPFLRDGSSPEEDVESLSLKLGGHSYAFSDDVGNGSRDAKRYRSSSPGLQFPSCQVDDCKADLSHAKDYHRRHKVCEMHAKAVKALVSRVNQRFCQQCSRFHPLTEFDEGKRSCRRRLAGHNRRRRKNQPDTPAGRGYTGLDENGTGKAAGLVGFLNILSSLQAVSNVGTLSGIVNERDALLQYLKKGDLLPPSGLDNLTVANLLNLSGLVPENGRHDLKPVSFSSNGHPQNRVAETEAFLSALAAPKSTEALSLLLQSSLRGQLTSALMKAAESQSPLIQVGQSSLNCALPVATPSARIPNEVLDHGNTGPILPQASLMAARPLDVHNLASSSRPNGIHQQVTGENSVQRVDQFQAELLQGQVTPLAMVQKLFPQAQAQAQAAECRSTGQFAVNVEDDRATDSTSDIDAPASAMAFLEGSDARTLQDVVSHQGRPAIDLQQPPPQYDMNESSPSGSDQSPSSSYADYQDHTGRISIKLFDRNPGELPQLLRSQILDWLSHRPSNMESYIRPGCTVLTVFMSMPKAAWEEIERDLRISLQKLTASCEFWSVGRILVQVDRRNAYIVDGKIYVSKPLKSIHAPELLSVRPFAVVAGQRSIIELRGRNLRRPKTRIFSAYQGSYDTLEILSADGQQRAGISSMSAVQETWCDQFSICFNGGHPNVVGRAFFEVEKQGGGGNAISVIVADGRICAELQMLEESKNIPYVNNFLNELGWLFQNSQLLPGVTGLPVFSPIRQKHLLTFAIERDWCAVVEKLLDILFGLVLACPDKTSVGLLEVFEDEISFLHLAVRRKCKHMVKLLLSYVPHPGDGSIDLSQLLKDICKHGSQSFSIFTPNMSGPEGLTPLHIAASMDGAEDIIDALTNDPNQIGLQAWSRALDAKGESPLACALSNRKVSYIRLVNEKIAQRHGSVIVDIASNRQTNMARQDRVGVNFQGRSSAKVYPQGKIGNTFGKTSTKILTTPLYALDLPLWSNKGPAVKSGGGTSMVCPTSCRHVPSILQGYKRGAKFKPFWVSMLCVAAVCVCACIIMKSPPDVAAGKAFRWNCLGTGSK